MSSTLRSTAAALALVFLGDLLLPTVAWALSSGPSQPEVESFKPASATDMVDLFTGDMSYNIPLLDVEGYPVNLSYSAGVGMDQEASWVGLGWNLGVGQVERKLRGIPDDFKGDQITRHMNLRPNRTYGLSYSNALQLFSVDLIQSGMSASPSFNNYDMFALELGINLSMRSTKPNKSAFTAGLGMTSSSNRGLTVQPQFGFEGKQTAHNQSNMTFGMNFGLSLNSRQGLSNMSLGATMKEKQLHTTITTFENGVATKVDKYYKTGAAANAGSASFDFGSSTYSPQITMPMRNLSLSFSFTGGGAVFGAHPNLTLGAFYSEQKLAAKTRYTPAYGYLHLDAGQSRDDAQLDFNREKDGPYSGDRPALGLSGLTNDFFSVTGQGIGGSFRPYRAEVGHVYDAGAGSSGLGGSAGLDVGAGLLAHGGARVMVNTSESSSGRWSLGSNQAGGRLMYKSLSNRPDLEPVYFREANEATVDQDPALFDNMRGGQAVRFTLPSNGAFDKILGARLTDGSAATEISSTNYRTQREPRGQLFSYLDHRSAADFGVNEPIAHAADVVQPHHISEVTVLNSEGARSVYGIPAYNIRQDDVEFNVYKEVNYLPTGSKVGYNAGVDNTENNENGKDHYYSRTITPPYAYAWLLTSVLSHDYSDVDDERGPSDGDLGTWTKFTYDRVWEDFEWRTPASGTANEARFIKGMEANPKDDKGTYVYGKKEVYYLDTIETKNYYAVFHTSNRTDAVGINEAGVANAQSLMKLDSITLHVKGAPAGSLPLKTVHFDYSYALCSDTPNAAAGKLTLKKVWFTYGASQRGITAPYTFDYDEGNTLSNLSNPNYDADAQDRWGGYKPNDPFLPNEDFPYVKHTDDDMGNPTPPGPDDYVGAWTLKSVTLPSGGRITVTLEADDYGYVQEKRAMRMFRVVGLSNSADSPPDMDQLTEYGNLGSSEYLWFRKPSDLDVAEVAEMVQGVSQLYFRFKVKVLNTTTNSYKGDYVSGYAQLAGTSNVGLSSDGELCYVKVKLVQMDEGSGDNVNPIRRAAIEFMRVHYAGETANTTVQSYDSDQPPGVNFFYSITGAVAGFIGGMMDFMSGPNGKVADAPMTNCDQWLVDKSYIKLNDPDHDKDGGGHRVASIAFTDAWGAMEAAEAEREYTYTQKYTYGDAEGSWGVAAYEPMMGADEIPHRKAVYYSESRSLSPDERFYMEEPFGETFFPSPVVGYGRVVVEDVVPEELRNTQGTGRVVHEFYTAREFPTQVRRTGLDPQRCANNANLFSLLGFKKIDHMHASQGFVVETNDMHGKPKSTTAYPEGSNEPVSYVRYEYGMEPVGANTWRVDNTETVINPDGTVRQAEIGRDYEMVADTRQFISSGFSGGADVKFELLYAFIAAIPVPLVLPKLTMESTRYRTGVLAKKLHRFGRVRKTIKMENGSVVSTENLAYDSRTGQVLVTRTANDFQDPIYSMTFPAYWHYDGMGGAYRNIGATIQAAVDGASRFTHPMASQIFVPGDELALVPQDGAAPLRAWVDQVDGNTVKLVRRTVASVAPLSYTIRVIRSGRRNMQGVPMMKLTSLTDPLLGMQGNEYAKLVNARAMEFASSWAIDCECLPSEHHELPLNRWVLNQRGVWRMSKEHAWLTERTRSVTNGNSNIRRDGVYASFRPFYEVVNGVWGHDRAGWTTTREVTLYNNSGQELENRDALGLYSSAAFGHRGTLAKSVARNARYQEAGFDGFEDPSTPIDCNDRHFRFSNLALETTQAHTGRHSARATSGAPLVYSFDNDPCPETPCSLEASYDAMNGGLTVTGGSAPYTIVPVVMGGNVSFLPSESGLTVTTSGSFAFAVTVTDATGCTITRNYNAPNN